MAYTRKFKPKFARRYKSRPRKRVPQTKPQLTRMVKRFALRECETKQSNQYTSTLQQLFHDRTYYSGQLLATTQGIAEPDGIEDATGNRIGNKVVARGLMLRFYLENQFDRPNVMYRIIVFKYNTLLLAQGASLTDNEFWVGLDGSGALSNRMLDSPQTRNLTILKSKFIKPTYQANYSIQTGGPDPIGAFSKTDVHQFWIPLRNKQIQYRDNNSTFPIRDGYGFAVVAFDTQNTAVSDHISNLMWRSQFYYKDP